MNKAHEKPKHHTIDIPDNAKNPHRIGYIDTVSFYFTEDDDKFAFDTPGAFTPAVPPGPFSMGRTIGPFSPQYVRRFFL